MLAFASNFLYKLSELYSTTEEVKEDEININDENEVTNKVDTKCGKVKSVEILLINLDLVWLA